MADDQADREIVSWDKSGQPVYLPEPVDGHFPCWFDVGVCGCDGRPGCKAKEYDRRKESTGG